MYTSVDFHLTIKVINERIHDQLQNKKRNFTFVLSHSFANNKLSKVKVIQNYYIKIHIHHHQARSKQSC
jgi:transcriptional regulator with AAA-type ATPase domain